jgi:hypothetical protein
MSRKYIEAFKDGMNWIGSGAVLAAGFLLPDPSLTPLIWLGYEAAYMLVVPNTAWFRRRLRRKREAELVHQREALRRHVWQSLLPEDRRRFEALERMRGEIGQQAEAGSMPPEMRNKLDELLEQFLQFGSKRAEYLGYLRALLKQELGIMASQRGWWGGGTAGAEASRPGEAMLDRLIQHYQGEIETIQAELEREPAAGSPEIQQKNLQLLQSCQENLKQIGSVLRNIDQQMELVLNTFTLINSQARTRAPEQMLSHVQEVVGSAEALSETLAAFAPLEQAVQQLGRSG